MSRLIDADAVIVALSKDIENHIIKNDTYARGKFAGIRTAIVTVNDSPTISDTTHATHGKWLPKGEECFGFWCCSNCNNGKISVTQTKYCSECGAKMEV